MTTWPLLWLVAQAATAPPAAPDTTAAPPPVAAPAGTAPPPPAAANPPPPAPPPPPPRRPPPPPVAPIKPFRLALTYVHVLREDGGVLANPDASTNAVGIDMAFPSNSYVRNHLGLAHQWESVNGVTARGFRIDLISLGYPIPLVTSPSIHLDLEPVLTILRGELMFVTDGPRFLRVESGFGLELSATVRNWFVMVQAFGIDFRYWVYSSDVSRTGFARVFPLRVALGHEF